MSQVIKLSIPDELAQRIEEQRGSQSVQEYTLTALRSALYGSPVEAELRADIERLHQTLRAFGITQPADGRRLDTSPLKPAIQVAEEDDRIGW